MVAVGDGSGGWWYVWDPRVAVYCGGTKLLCWGAMVDVENLYKRVMDSLEHERISDIYDRWTRELSNCIQTLTDAILPQLNPWWL